MVVVRDLETHLTLINYGSDDFDIFRVAEGMTERGWLVGLTKKPRGMHAMMSMLHEPARAQFLSDLAECVAAQRGAEDERSALTATY